MRNWLEILNQDYLGNAYNMSVDLDDDELMQAIDALSGVDDCDISALREEAVDRGLPNDLRFD